MKKIFMTVFCVVIAAIAIIAIRYVSVISMTNTINPELTTEERAAAANGFIMREEHVFTAQTAGTVYSSLSEGDRVSKDAYVATVYNGEVSSDKLKELGNLDKKIIQAVSDERKKSYYTYDDSVAGIADNNSGGGE